MCAQPLHSRSPEMDQQLQGVTYDSFRRMYKARIFYSGQERFIGRYNSSKEAALAYDQAARFVNSQLSAGPKQIKTPGSRPKRARPLNFPDMCPKVACRLQIIFRDAAAKRGCWGTTAAGTSAAAARQSEQAEAEQKLSDALSEHAAGQACAGQPAVGLSSVTRTAGCAAAHQAGAVTAAACSALRTPASGDPGLAAASTPSCSAAEAAAVALSSAFAGAATIPASPAAAAAPARLAGAGSAAAFAVGTAAGADPAPGAGVNLSPADSRAGSCELHESAATSARAVHHQDGALAGSGGGAVPQLNQQAQQEQQQQEQLLRRLAAGDGASAQQLHPGAGGSAFPAVTADGARLEGRAALIPQQQLQVQAQSGMPDVPDFHLGSGSLQLTSLPLLDSLEDAEWQQLLALLDGAGRDDAVNTTEGLPAGNTAGAAGGTPAFGGMGMQQGHAAGTGARAWQQQQCFQQQPHGTHNLAPLSAASRRVGGGAEPGQQGIYLMPQGSGTGGSSSCLVPTSSLGLPAAAAAPYCAVAPGADTVMGAFAGAGGAHAAATALAPTAEPWGPLLAGTDTTFRTGMIGAAAIPGAAALMSEPAVAVGEPAGPLHRPPQSVALAAAPGASTRPAAAAAATAGMGLLSCVGTPQQALQVIGRLLQGLEDLSEHLQQQPQLQQHANTLSSTSSSPVGSVLDWLQAAWYLETVSSGTLAVAAPPAAVAAAISAVKAARPTGSRPNRLALLLLEQLAVLCSDTLAAAAAQGGAGIIGAAAHSYVYEVLRELQQGMAAMQRFVATIPAGAEICCAQLLEAYVASKYLPGSPESSMAVAETLWRLARLL